MGVEDGGLTNALVESAVDDMDDEDCPCCESSNWLRAVAAYTSGSCWVIYCGGCGKTVQRRWNIVP